MTSLSNQHQASFSRSVRRQVRRLGFLGQFLLITSTLATSAGIGFGIAVRFNRPSEPGSSILHSDQSFPPRQDWPISNESH